MNSSERAITADELGRALGFTPQAARHRLRQQKCVFTRRRGMKARAWFLPELSPDVRDALEERARELGFRNLDGALSSTQLEWQPLREVSSVDRSIAEKLCCYVAPLLGADGGRSAISDLARRADAIAPLRDFVSSECIDLRALVVRAKRRAGDMENFGHWKLYLPAKYDHLESPRNQSRPRGRRKRPSRLNCGAEFTEELRSEFRQAVGLLGAEPSELEICQLFDQAFRFRAAGVKKSQLIDALSAAPYFAGCTRESMERAFERKQRAWVSGGKTVDALFDRRETNGRRPLAVLSEDQQREVQKLVLATDPNTSGTVSVSMALRMFAHSDKCPQEIADVILKPRKSKHTLTPTLKRQARVTAESKMLYRGDKNFSLDGALSQPRSLTWIDASGHKRPILAGDIFEPDDMTLNQPWYVEWSDSSDPCAARFGVRILRGQLLLMVDVAAQRVISFSLIARTKDSYRAEDIWSWFGQVFRDHGLPRIGIRMERGIWEANTIHGIPIVDETWSNKIRLGGLRELGVEAIRSYSPRTKSIESLFNSLQKAMGVTGVQVGRRRGEFEKATRDYLACRAGKKHPADCGFLHADELVKRISNACLFLNQDCREGEVYKGVPDEIWQRDIDTAPLRMLDPAKSWVFMRYKRPLTIGSPYAGLVRARCAETACSFYFSNPELFASLGRGYRVVACFDPAIPEQGAVIFNAESGPRDHTNAGIGQHLGHAEFVERVPQYSAAEGFDDEAGYERRRRFTEQCRRTYRQIPLPGRRPSASTLIRDGKGNEISTESGPRTAYTSPETPNEREGRALMRQARAASDAGWSAEQERAQLDRIDLLEAEFDEREPGFLRKAP